MDVIRASDDDDDDRRRRCEIFNARARSRDTGINIAKVFARRRRRVVVVARRRRRRRACGISAWTI